MISLTELNDYPDGSLARNLLSMWVDNGFDPEVLDRDAIGLSDLSPALGYLNTRILQMHDTWHLVAGYETTSLHEMAISAFQLARVRTQLLCHVFEHGLYDERRCASLRGSYYFCRTSQRRGFTAVRHPKFMAIEWEQGDWHMNIDEVRATSMESHHLPGVFLQTCWSNSVKRRDPAQDACVVGCCAAVGLVGDDRACSCVSVKWG